jgi:lysine 2,3-aminomutase
MTTTAYHSENDIKQRKRLQGLDAFVQAGLISATAAAQMQAANPFLAASITQDMVDLLPKDPKQWATDPIALQFIPNLQELHLGEDTLEDPLGDRAHMPVEGVVHRHADRCLLMPLSVCALYCRFCFRKEQIGPGMAALSPAQLELAYGYIQSRPELFEVILSGGDPLMLKPKAFNAILTRLTAMDHIKVIRIHTRIPVVDTDKITDDLLAVLRQHKPIYLVLHINHAKELHPKACQAIARLQEAGVIMLSQSVLLKGVNDTIDALEELMRSLVVLGVKPYYIHQLDPARGIDHFKVEKDRGKALMQALHARCSGLCQPRYVEDVPGGLGAKTPIS